MRIFVLAVVGCLLLETGLAQQPAAAREQPSAGKSQAAEQTRKRAEKAVDAAPSDKPSDGETAKSRHERKASGARLRFDDATYDFGDVPRKGGDLVREFTFTNVGTTPLVLVRVITSCSCLKASFSKRPVAPGQTGVVSITYEPHKSEPGAFNKVIQVFSNSVDVRDVITVQGNSIDEELKKLKTDKYKIKTR